MTMDRCILENFSKNFGKEFSIEQAYYAIVMILGEQQEFISMFGKHDSLYLIGRMLKKVSTESVGTFVLYNSPVMDDYCDMVTYNAISVYQDGKSIDEDKTKYNEKIIVSFDLLKESYEHISLITGITSMYKTKTP